MAQLPPTTRRDEIVAGAAELFARNGIAATTVRDIGEAVGMLSGSLYHYFTSKEEIVDAIISSYLDDLRLRYRDAIEDIDDPIEQLRALIHASFHSVAEFPAACEIYQ
jgi:AcrR family transcriptional regulator